jgi:hypothetical protein
VSAQQKWKVTRLDDIESRGAWLPVREHLGVKAFGINAYRPRDDGRIINDHDEKGSGQQELYVVLEGTATFVVDGQEVEAPAGTLVFVEPESQRTATGDATVLVVGAKPGEAFQSIDWGTAWPLHSESLTAYGEERYGDALEAVKKALADNPEHPGLHYNYACFATLAGDTSDETFEHLRRSVALFEPFRTQAREDTDFTSVRDDPRFEAALT